MLLNKHKYIYQHIIIRKKVSILKSFDVSIIELI